MPMPLVALVAATKIVKSVLPEVSVEIDTKNRTTKLEVTKSENDLKIGISSKVLSKEEVQNIIDLIPPSVYNDKLTDEENVLLYLERSEDV